MRKQQFQIGSKSLILLTNLGIENKLQNYKHLRFYSLYFLLDVSEIIREEIPTRISKEKPQLSSFC